MSADPGARRLRAPVVVIIGTGLIGTSIGTALTSRGHSVHLRDHKLSHARVAESLGAGTVTPPPTADVGLVVVAVPPRELPVLIRHALEQYPSAVVTDVGSVKAGVLNALWGHPEVHRYVGSHPMAGSQHSGPVAARADLFVERTWVITPHRRSDPDAVAAVAELATACGARTVTMDVEEHDAAVARVSHLPHVMAVLMAGHLTTVPDGQLVLAGQGLRDVTRVAGSDPHLWEQILSSNASAVAAELRQVHSELSAVIAAIEAAPSAETPLRDQLERGVRGTQKIPGKHGSAPTAYSQVVVEIPDTPGALGRLFADVGEAGVNVEDIAIEHDQIRQVGYLSLAVTPDQADSLAELMRARGWDVQP